VWLFEEAWSVPMRILLVDPPCHRFMGFRRHYFPLGLTCMAGELCARGHDVLVYDGELDPSVASTSVLEADGNYHLYLDALETLDHPVWCEFRSLLADFSPDVVGFSTLSVKVRAVLLMAGFVKAHDPRITTVAGGDHATVRPQDLLGSGYVDCVVRGEGEMTIVELIACLARGADMRKVRGLSWMQNGRLHSTPSMPLVTALDALTGPKLEALHREDAYRPVDMGLMVTERGCPYSCTYCGLATIAGRALRYHSIAGVVNEIARRNTVYGTEYFSIRNGTFTLNRKRVIALSEALTRLGLGIGWECLTRVDLLDGSLLEAMVAGGCRAVRIGVESGSEAILRYMHKSIKIEQVVATAKLLNSIGIFWSAYIMIGVPEETEDSINATLALLERIDPPFITLAKYTPIPGTSMYRDVIAAGLLDEDSTDWTWALNQSVHGTFVKRMDENAFSRVFRDVAAFVAEHNERKRRRYTDPRDQS
jgi:anaerobic magnesium-protoporphyrin IX monomethyl ester cyclase